MNYCFIDYDWTGFKDTKEKILTEVLVSSVVRGMDEFRQAARQAIRTKEHAPPFIQDALAGFPRSGDRYPPQVRLHGADCIVCQRQVRLFGMPVLVKPGDGLTCGIQDQLFRQVGPGGQV